MRAALAVLAVVPVVAGCAEARALPCRDLPGTAGRILPSPHIAYAGTSHAPYSSSPPTSGPHVPFTVAPGVYREPLARELQVHALEHGHVLVQYPVEIAGAGRRDVEDSARRDPLAPDRQLALIRARDQKEILRQVCQPFRLFRRRAHRLLELSV